jgi:hypothetical protein
MSFLRLVPGQGLPEAGDDVQRGLASSIDTHPCATDGLKRVIRVLISRIETTARTFFDDSIVEKNEDPAG